MGLKIFNNIFNFKKKDKVLVLSGGGFRGLYTVGILKGLQELGIDKDIKAVFGVSIGAIVGGLRCNGISAEEIFGLFMDLSIDKFYGKEIFTKTGGLLSNRKIKGMINEYICDNFFQLQKKLYVGVVDTNTAKYKLYDSGKLHEIILGSMSIPGVFPPVKYEKNLFVDGGLLNNFPADFAKEIYPNHTIIGVDLNLFQENQKIKTARDNVMRAYEILLRSKALENTKYVDYLFRREIDIPVLSLDKDKLERAYNMGYNDCIEKLKNIR